MAALQPSRTDPQNHSILPSVPGVHAGVAVLIAVGCTLLGAAVDAARGTELTRVFALAYMIGCVIAVLLVRRRGLFTAAVQPPLILFLAVPFAYQYMSKGGGTGIKDIVLNDAVPLVNRFPLMAAATVAVLAIAALRMMLHRGHDTAGRVKTARAARGSESPASTRTSRSARSRSKSTKQARPAKGDTVKDKLDRITAKANELQTQSDVPAASRSARPATGPMAAADPSRSRRSRGTEDRDWPSDRSSRGESQWTGRSRRETPNSRVDPRFPTGGSRHGTPRPDAPSHPTPRYRDGFDR